MHDRKDVYLALVGEGDGFQRPGRAALRARDTLGIEEDRSARRALLALKMGIRAEFQKRNNRARSRISCLGLFSHENSSERYWYFSRRPSAAVVRSPSGAKFPTAI